MKLNRDPKPPLPDISENTNLLVLLIDSQRRVQNLIMPENPDSREPLDDMAGKPPGEVLCCCNAEDYPEGCGNTPACGQCEINRAIREAMERCAACYRRKARLNKPSGETRFSCTVFISTMCIDNGENQADPRILMCVEETHQLKQTMTEIAEQKAQLNSLFHTSPIALGFVEPLMENEVVRDRIIRDVNERLCEMTGYRRDQLVGKSARILYLTKDDYDRVALEIQEQIAQKGLGTMETRWQTKNGQSMEISLRSAPIDPQNLSLGLSFTGMDITDQKQAAKERKKLEERLRHSQKLEAVGKLSGGIAHEFNNLLQIINGYADLMADELEQHHPSRAYLNEISAAGSRAADMVRHLLAFSRKQIMQMKEVEINGLIEKTVSMLRGLIGEKIEIDYIPGRHVGRAHLDAAHIQQVLLNLCLNAKDAMPEGGTMTIETENVLINGQYCRTHEWAEPGRFALISVTDAGCGMDSQTAARIFEPFFTTKPREKNNGMGLSTAYGIICQHQGMINVYSEPGRGTMFKIYLPVTQRQATDVEVNLQGRVKGGTETLLVAEDDEMVCDLMQTVLSRAGYNVFCARDGETAIELFAQNRDKIDLAVLDVVMPVKDGRQVHDAIKEFSPDFRVLFSSGYNGNAIHTNFVLHEGMQLLQKPFTTDELLRKVRSVLDADKPSKQ